MKGPSGCNPTQRPGRSGCNPTQRPGRSRCKPKKKAKAGQRWADSPDSSSDVEAWPCLVCGEPYGNSR